VSEILDLLGRGDLRVLGRIIGSSNSALLVEVSLDGQTALAIHKPIAFERPLWDYPNGDLAHREHAAYLISEAGGFEVVPPTVVREGPWGLGSTQQWVGDPDQPIDPVVVVCAAAEVPQEWLRVIEGQDEDGEAVVLAHAADSAVRSVAVLDAVLNNSDRKGSHLVRVDNGVRGFDHGVSLGVEPKLRSVLWGWAGDPLPSADVDRLDQLASALSEPILRGALTTCLTADEVAALEARVALLRRTRRHPVPTTDWPAIPWPAM